MTIKTKKRLGHAFVISTFLVISFCTQKIISKRAEILHGQVETLKKIDGETLSESIIKVNYKHAHGIDIVHANILQKDTEAEADFSVLYDDEKVLCVYVENDQVSSFRTSSQNITIKTLKTFDGEILVKNNVCGCEDLVCLVLFVYGSALCIVLCITALVFYASANKQKLAMETGTPS